MHKQIRTIIVEDEDAPREVLEKMLVRYGSAVQLIGSASSVEEGYEMILNKKPDLVLLDIMMPPSTGFDLLKRFPRIGFEVIFTTAYSEFAIQAIKQSALDYLLKPVDEDELRKAIYKMEERLSKQNAINPVAGKLLLETDKSIIFINPSEIIRVEPADRKLRFLLRGGKEHIVSQSMDEAEVMLENLGFFRSHRTHIINLSEIKEYVPDRHGGCVVMTDGKLVPVSERRREEFIRQFM